VGDEATRTAVRQAVALNFDHMGDPCRAEQWIGEALPLAESLPLLYPLLAGLQLLTEATIHGARLPGGDSNRARHHARGAGRAAAAGAGRLARRRVRRTNQPGEPATIHRGNPGEPQLAAAIDDAAAAINQAGHETSPVDREAPEADAHTEPAP
jgi:hypothetical protein